MDSTEEIQPVVDPAEEKPSETVTFVKETKPEIAFAKKPIKMPILPAEPCKAVDGREVTQELIDGVLSYDAAKRKAVVGLNKDAAHGTTNLPVLGRVEKVYKQDGFIYADVLPVKEYEDILSILASEQFPDRSIEADWLNMDGSDSKQLYLEAIKLCGSERPALNLPSVSFTTTSTGKEIFKFTFGGGSPMPEKEQVTETPQPVAVAEPPQPIYGVAEPIEKAFARMKAESAAQRQADQERIAALEAERLDEKLDIWSKSPKMLRKLPSYARINAVNAIKAAKTGQPTATFHFAKGPETVDLGDHIKALLESLPDTLISTGTIAGDYPNQFEEVPVSVQDKQKIAWTKIRAYAKENNLDLSDTKQLTKAENAVKRENPDLWEGTV